MSSSLLPQFLPQCCDAVLYLLQGEQCATRYECYDQLRPIGAQLWFSLPFHFGVPTESLILVHWLLLFISIALSVPAAATLAKLNPANTIARWFLLATSTLAHLVFFWPVMQLALTDAPAALFALIAIWLLIRNESSPTASRLALAGLLLGCSAWIRFAYYYPLLGMLAVYILLWLRDKQRRRVELLLLTALLPIALQYTATFLYHGSFGFLGPRASAGLSSEHSLSYAAGQETILPAQQYLWPTGCDRKIGIEQALAEKDLLTATCLTAYRFYFSFGSYAPDTYMFAAVNQLTHAAIEHVGLDNRWQHWRVNGIRRITTTETMATPDGTGRSFNQKLIAFAEPLQQERSIAADKRLPRDLPYTFSVWLWAPASDTIDLVLREKNGEDIARNTVTMTSQPTRFFVTGTAPQDSGWFAEHYADIEVLIGATTDHPNSFAARPMAEFYAWGAQLELSPVMTAYADPQANVTHTDFRHWSPLLLLANTVAMLSVLLLLLISRRHIGRGQMTAAVFMGLIVAEIIVTQPEQRFVIAVEVYIWVCAAVIACRWLGNKLFVVRT